MVVSLLDNPNCDWAIVTNGKIWRLYSAKAHSRATNYYQIDLEETLALPAASIAAAFPYFWHFFRAAAFVTGDRRNGQLPPGMDALPADERARLLEPFFSGTLAFLYRLLFLLYAESRDLLPAREARGYSEKSLEKLKRQVAEKAGTLEGNAPDRLKDAYNELGTAFYDRLQELFAAVDKGEPSLNVPVYNGGLFITHPDPADASPEAAVARFLPLHLQNTRPPAFPGTRPHGA